MVYSIAPEAGHERFNECFGCFASCASTFLFLYSVLLVVRCFIEAILECSEAPGGIHASKGALHLPPHYLRGGAWVTRHCTRSIPGVKHVFVSDRSTLVQNGNCQTTFAGAATSGTTYMQQRLVSRDTAVYPVFLPTRHACCVK